MHAITEWNTQRAIVVGGTRGLGRGIAVALAGAGAHVTVVGRHADAIDHTRREAETIEGRVGDATDAAWSSNLVAEIDPSILVLALGATPMMAPLHRYDWEAFGACWNTDVKATFHWLRDALTRPMRAGGRIVVISSGAARAGSAVSGGYAGAKQTQRFLCNYARDDAQRLGVQVGIQCLLPKLNANTRLGIAGIRAYAARAGMEPGAFTRAHFSDGPTPSSAGRGVVALLEADVADHNLEAMLGLDGLGAVPT